MRERHLVVLYGSSLLMAGMEASLRHQPGLDVARIDATLPNVAQRLSALQPDVVIFDLTIPPSDPSTTLRTGFQPPASSLQPPFSKEKRK
jgi:DNA-binding NarL/FixJ family response regulator